MLKLMFKFMNKILPFNLLLLFALFPTASQADTIKDGVICSYDKSICIDGVLSVDDASGLAKLRGRVKKTTRPGYLRIKLHGYEKNRVLEAYIQGRLKGKYSEVVNLKNSASHSSDAKWKIIRVEYLKIEE